MPRVYLSGPMQHLDDLGKSWREMVKEDYPSIDWLDPHDKDIEEEKGEDPDYLARPVLSEALMEGDKEMIDEADAVLLFRSADAPSHGAGREHEYAVQTDTPVFTWTTINNPSPCLVADSYIVSRSLSSVVQHISRHFADERGAQAAFERGL
jgi:hypothetical protein